MFKELNIANIFDRQTSDFSRTTATVFGRSRSLFSQDLDLARKLLDSINDARNSVPEQPLAFKTEILHDPGICLPGNTEETYMSKDGRIKKENYRQLIERKNFPIIEI